MTPLRALLVLGTAAALVLLAVLLPSRREGPEAASAARPSETTGRPLPVRPLEPTLAGVRASRDDPTATAADGAQATRTGQAGPAVRGRCVARGTGAPLPGVQVHLVVWSREGLEEWPARADAKGRFEFESPGNRVSWAEVRRPAPWIAERPRFRLSPEQRLGQEEVVFELEEALTVSGRVVDAATGEGVPGLEVNLRVDDGYSDEVATDAAGVFSSRGRLLDRPLRLTVQDRGGLVPLEREGRRVHALELEDVGVVPLELAAAIGPTFRLRVAADRELRPRRLRARVVQTPPDGREVAWPWVRLRDDDGPAWIRYDECPDDAPVGGPGRLEVRHVDASLGGSAPVRTTAGVHPGVIRVVLDASARVSGRVVDAEGRVVQRARVSVTPLDADARERAGRSSTSGSFEIEPVPPGRCRLVASAPGMPTLEREVVLHVGRNAVGDLRLARRKGGAVRGILRFDPVVAPLRAYVRLVPESGEGAVRAVAPRRLGGEGVDPVFHFDFGEVAEGAYTVEVVSRDHYPWEPSRLAVAPPENELVFVRDESASGYLAGFLPVDARTGEAVERFRVRLTRGSTWYPSEAWSFGETRGPFAPDERLEWTLSATGYRPAHGTERDLGGESETRFAAPRLEPGFGLRLHLRDATGFHASPRDEPWTYRSEALRRPPLAGVPVQADGRTAGRTDENGVVTLALGAAPERVEPVLRGWRVVDSDVLEGGRPMDGRAEGIVWMARERP